MKLLASRLLLLPLVILVTASVQDVRGAGGIAPEQIFQEIVKPESLIGTWEVLPDETPLAEQEVREAKSRPRTLLTLRKDFTGRIFDLDHPSGSDGSWIFENHALLITLQSGAKVEFYVYGVKGDFMVTRSPIKGGKDQLWSRVK
ncbi:MAG: hypothetical protein HY913_10610 [Desulfomonile tiedjei]|nr:hypothetical protein [Desulfomonile tiedjei]